MANELFCPFHGPYDASYGTCPYCSGEYKRPAPPASLSEDDLPTDFDGFNRPQAGGMPMVDTETPTELSPRHPKGKRFLDSDDITDTSWQAMGDTTEVDFETTGLMGILWVKEGHRRGQIYSIKDNTVVGRGSAELVLDDPKVSNPHAKFTVEDNQFVIWDFGSRNGTYVNGERIRGATPLKENDTIKMGNTTFILKILS